MFAVSYYVDSERYWQFAGEFKTKREALVRAQELGVTQVRTRRV